MGKNPKKQYMIFASNLRKAYDDWRKKTGKTMQHLADEVGLMDRKSISNYLNATQYPEEDILNNLCNVLGTTPDDLNGLNDSFLNRYRYVPDTANSIRDGYKSFCAGIGLNNNFLKYVRSALPDESFPLYTPISCDIGEDRYIRNQPFETAETTGDEEFQIKYSNIHTDLTYPDYAFLKEVQDKVADLIEYLYYKRKKELADSLSRINSDCVETLPNGVKTVKHASKEKLCEYDPYYRYLLGDQGIIIEKEEKRRKESDNGKH